MESSDRSITLIQRLEDKVDRLVEVVSEMKGSLLVRVDSQGKQINDHETRIRRLEKFRYAIPSAAFISCCVAIGTLVFYLTHATPTR